MKKLLAWLLTTTLLLSISACGEKNNNNDNGHNSNNDTSFNEIVVIDNNDCTIKIKAVDPNNKSGYSLKVEFKNKSTNKTYMASVDSASINGIDCQSDFALEIKPKEKTTVDVILLSNLIKENNIGDFTDIEVTFLVFELGNWEAGPIVLETFHIYPYGQDKANQYVREIQPTDNVIIDNDYVKVIVVGYNPKGKQGYSVNLFLLNKTNKVAMFTIEKAFVNEHNIDPYYTAYVSANGCAFSSITWPINSLKDNGISDVTEIKLLFNIVNYENWQGDYYVKDTFILKP